MLYLDVLLIAIGVVASWCVLLRAYKRYKVFQNKNLAESFEKASTKDN